MAVPYRILLATTEAHGSDGGIGRYCVELAIAARERGAAATLLPLTSPRPHGMAQSKATRLLVATRRLHDHLGRAESANVLHATDLESIVAVAVQRRALRGTSLYATVHGTEILYLANRLPSRARHLILEPFERVLCNSSFTSGLFRAVFPRYRGELRVTRLGVDSQFLHTAREEHTGFRVLSVGRMDPRKGHDVTIQALQHLPETMRLETQLDIVTPSTEGEYGNLVLTLAEQSSVPVHIHVRLADEDLRALYAKADVFSLIGRTSRRHVEGFGLAFLEAAAVGVPSIATRVDAVPELFSEHEACFVDAAEPSAVARQMVRLWEAPEVRRSIAASARARATQYSWDACALGSYGP